MGKPTFLPIQLHRVQRSEHPNVIHTPKQDDPSPYINIEIRAKRSDNCVGARFPGRVKQSLGLAHNGII